MPRETKRPGHVLEGDALAAALIDQAEDLSEQGLVVEPEIHPPRSLPAARVPPAGASGEQGPRLPVAVVPLAKL